MGMCFSKKPEEPLSDKQTQKNKDGQIVISESKYKTKTANQMSEKDRNMLSLKKVRDDLYSRMQEIDKSLAEAAQDAKKHMQAGNKVRAKFALERKQLYSKYEDNVLNQQKVINDTLNKLQQAYENKAAVEALNAANKLMIDINKTIDLDQMSDAMDNLQELEMNNNKFTELYKQYVGEDTEYIDDQVKQMEVEIAQEAFAAHDANTQKLKLNTQPVAIQPKNQQEQPFVQQPQQQKQQQKPKDDIDDQLAMLA